MIGLEREVRLKSAGLRTHTLVGFAAALMMLVSKYGFLRRPGKERRPRSVPGGRPDRVRHRLHRRGSDIRPR
ncbi:MgtC/SapB family protein [Streptosporangium vulgare]|uniref:MgtC/SapB family protein n=1 Tax=Streptosporangium vulgare TaxID=46190 RepID=UPI0031D3F07D